MVLRHALIAVTASAVVLTGLAHRASAAPAPAPATTSTSSMAMIEDNDYDDLTEAQLLPAMQVIEDIPEDVIAAGDEAVRAHLEVEVGKLQDAENAAVRGAWACAVAVGVAILSNVFTVAKVLKIRAAIKVAGGSAKFAKKTIAAYKYARKGGMNKWDAIRYAGIEMGKGLGGETVAALLSLFVIDKVVKECF
ncbi:hypothetical protein [Pilimelia columellifera]|uniref:Secreted protein n=1 Tax=Pilimelia columellifera subsp. columellifera TaxID=706583 RepID=A0ABN3NKS0_9ACTN